MMLKTLSGEFDVESIHSLTLRDMGECTSLLEQPLLNKLLIFLSRGHLSDYVLGLLI